MGAYMGFAQYIDSRLPGREFQDLRSEPDFYGASRVIKDGSDFKRDNIRSYATWMHGWTGRDFLTWDEVDWACTGYPVSLVTNDSIRDTLPESKVRVEAVGLPYVYVQHDKYSCERIPSSLLVMPAHSLPYANQVSYEEEYLQSSLPYFDHFDHVCFCLHSSCVERGVWIDLLDRHGIAYISGAAINDMNSLYRMHVLFNTFETMTTNVFGSHILYAAYSGMKVSVFRYMNMMKINDYSNTPQYIRNPKLLNIYKRHYEFDNIRRLIGQFVATPDHAVSSKEWAYNHIGHPHKREYSEIADLLGWPGRKQKHYYFRYHLLRKAKQVTKKIIRHEKASIAVPLS
jgi:hypothetical protein